jgi:hypothetical protein
MFFIISIITLDKVQSQSLSIPQSLLDSIIDPNSGLPIGVTEQVEIEQIPRIPNPGDLVNLKIISYLTDLNKAQIIWTTEEGVISSGIGNTSISIIAPPSGQSVTVQVRIIKNGGGEILQTISINPAGVDLIYEANTYTHPLYKGKKLFTSESTLRFIALPNFVDQLGNKIDDSNLIYTWKVNDVVQNTSGFGKNIFVRQGTLIERPVIVSVEVSDLKSNFRASKRMQIRSQAPEIILYENNPLLGVVYEKAIQGEFLLERPQVDFEGVPYFFSVPNKEDTSLKWRWAINGFPQQTKLSTENFIVLKNAQNEDGRAIITAQVEHVNNILQTAKNRFDLNFKKVNNTNNEEFVF